MFPLEEGAAVTGCSAVVEGKKITAIIQENKKAEQMYKEAVRDNKTAVMLSSSRPDVFQMKVQLNLLSLIHFNKSYGNELFLNYFRSIICLVQLIDPLAGWKLGTRCSV